jgi:hypothetical protein
LLKGKKLLKVILFGAGKVVQVVQSLPSKNEAQGSYSSIIKKKKRKKEKWYPLCSPRSPTILIVRYCLKIEPILPRARGVGQSLECLLSKLEALNSNLSTAKTKQTNPSKA